MVRSVVIVTGTGAVEVTAAVVVEDVETVCVVVYSTSIGINDWKISN